MLAGTNFRNLRLKKKEVEFVELIFAFRDLEAKFLE